MPPPLFLFPPFPSLHLHPRSQPAPLPLHLLPPSPACLPGLLRLLLKSPKDSRGRILRRRAGVRALLTCSARSEARPPPSGPATAGAFSRRPARGLGSGARRGLARSCSGTDAPAKSSAVAPRGRGSGDLSPGPASDGWGHRWGTRRSPVGAMETATSGGALGRGRRRGGTASRGGRGLHGRASGSGPPSSPPPPPPPASPAGARG